MSFKPITKSGEQFIVNAVKANKNNFTGTRSFKLGRSNVPVGTQFTSNAKFNNVKITDNATLAQAIITWYNKYCSVYLLDANILAAQGYAESNYVLWQYSNGGSPNYSSAMGISQFLDSAVYEFFKYRPNGSDAEDEDISVNESNVIFNGLSGDLTDVKNIIPYRDGSTPTTNATALANRQILFQNIIDNPEIMIKAQCRYMHDIGLRNQNLAASSLFAYTVGGYLTSKTYNEIINTAAKKKYNVQDGTNYVEKIFRILGGEGATKSLGRFYDIDFSLNDQANKNLSDSILVTGDFGLGLQQEKFVQQLHPLVQDKFRGLIQAIESQTPYKVQVQSSYRSFGYQQYLKDTYAIKYPSVPVGRPGRSYHQYGLALDITMVNPKYPNDVYSHNKTEQQWRDTGVPAIAEKLGFVWGGTFTVAAGSKYDPVHFDLSNTYALKSLYNSAVAQFGSDPNKIQGNKISNLQPSSGGYS